MSCCPGPEHGRAFDVDQEAPSEADMAKFGGDDDDQLSDYDDQAFDQIEDRWDKARSKEAVILVGAALVIIAILLVALL